MDLTYSSDYTHANVDKSKDVKIFINHSNINVSY